MYTNERGLEACLQEMEAWLGEMKATELEMRATVEPIRALKNQYGNQQLTVSATESRRNGSREIVGPRRSWLPPQTDHLPCRSFMDVGLAVKERQQKIRHKELRFKRGATFRKQKSFQQDCQADVETVDHVACSRYFH
jgi:hypothetical protein